MHNNILTNNLAAFTYMYSINLDQVEKLPTDTNGRLNICIDHANDKPTRYVQKLDNK